MANSGLSLTILCALALYAHTVITCEAIRKGPHAHPDPHPRLGKFVRTEGTKFVLHGSPFLFNGFNSHWMMSVAVDPAERYKVTQVFREAALAGLTVCRTWAFNDGDYRALQVSPGVYDEQVFQALDFVIAEARKFGIRLILSFVNNYEDYGGRAQYVQWARNPGVPVNSEDDFYTNEVVKEYYKNHINAVLNRYNTFTKISYKDDAMIMAWELINEPRCQTDYSGRTVNAWIQEMASYTKSLDSKHLLEIGLEGFYGDSMPDKQQHNPGYQVGTDFITNNLIKEVDFRQEATQPPLIKLELTSSTTTKLEPTSSPITSSRKLNSDKQRNPGYQVGTDFITNNLVKEIDFATIHAYPDQWLSEQSEQTHSAFMEQWMRVHWEDAGNILKKPLVFTEFGKTKNNAGHNVVSRDTFFGMIYRNIYSNARAGGSMAGGLVWQLMADGMESCDDGYGIVLSRDMSTSGVISRQSRAMAELARTMSV